MTLGPLANCACVLVTTTRYQYQGVGIPGPIVYPPPGHTPIPICTYPHLHLHIPNPGHTTTPCTYPHKSLDIPPPLWTYLPRRPLLGTTGGHHWKHTHLIWKDNTPVENIAFPQLRSTKLIQSAYFTGLYRCQRRDSAHQPCIWRGWPH